MEVNKSNSLVQDMDLKYSLKKQKAGISSSFLPIGDTPVQVFYNTHLVSEVRNFRHCDRVNNVTCQILYILENNKIKVVNIYEIRKNKCTTNTYTIDFQSVYAINLGKALIREKTKLCVWLNAEREHPDPNILTLMSFLSIKNLWGFLTKSREECKTIKRISYFR